MPHTTTFIADDCIQLTLSGVIAAQDISDICDAEVACAQKNGYVLMVVDATQVTGLPAETRRFASQMLPRLQSISGIAAVFGTSSTTRVLFSMLLGAMRILSMEKSSFAARFVKTEAEALRCLAESRAAFRSEPRQR